MIFIVFIYKKSKSFRSYSLYFKSYKLLLTIMTQKYSFSECYLLLNINPDSEWEDVRKSYKRLIQKWHPDRFELGSEKQSIANAKITNINLAYRELSKYYRIHRSLPIIDDVDTDIEKTGSTDLDKTSYSDASLNNSQNHTGVATQYEHSTNSRYLIFIVVAGFALYFLYPQLTSNQSDNWQQGTQEELLYMSEGTTKAPIKSEVQEQVENKNVSGLSLLSNQPDSRVITNEENYFTFGSTIGEIITIQGPPDKIINDVWYYGDSEVHFKDGVVVYWKRSAGSVLNARLKTESYLDNKK